ncbi:MULTISPECIES: condensation domain-containing protein [unclassified Streptomyces]|uniref:condensation domain-containing protein n=1 Tax=unclassified Streptomyces TaxID=2593676 RepID=UPI0033B1EFDE
MTITLRAGRELSDMQQSMLAHESIGALPVYNMPLCFEITGTVDAPALEAALHHVVRRHPVLNSTYADGRALPLPQSAPLPPLDTAIERCADGAVPASLSRLWERPMDLGTHAPVRAGFVSTSPDHHYFGLCVHHVAGDSWSLALLLEELGSAYGALRHGDEPAARPPAPDFFDHAAEEQTRNWDTTWWRARLDGVRPQPHPRTDPPPPAERGTLVETGLELDASATRGVRELARTARVSPTAVLLTAVSLAVADAGAADAGGTEHTSTVGLPAVLRDAYALQATMGPLLTTLPVRTAWRERATSTELVQAHADAISGALAHKDVPYSRVLKAAGVRRRPGTAPLFLHVVNADNETPRLRLSGVRTVLRPITPKWAIFPAQWEFSWKAVGNIRGVLQVSADVFTAEQAQDCVGRFRSSLTRLLMSDTKGFS